MCIDLTAEGFSQSVHMPPEAERKVYDNIYDCWQPVPLDKATYTIRRNYPVSQEQMAKVVHDNPKIIHVGPSVLPDSGEISDKECIVEYRLPLSGLHFPDRLTIGPVLNIRQIVDYLTVFENMHAAPKYLEYDLSQIADCASMALWWTIREMMDYQIKRPWDDQVFNGMKMQFADFTDHLRTIFPQYAGMPNSEFIQNIYQLLDQTVTTNAAIIGEKGERALRGLLEKDWSREIKYDNAFIPHPAIYHDLWHDSRFKDGYYPSAIHMGNLPSATGGNELDMDQDVSATVALVRDALVRMDRKTPIYDSSVEIFTPPNMTNLFIIAVPGITDQVEQIERDFTADEELSPALVRYHSRTDGRFHMVVCEDPQRINPNDVKKILDEKYGAGSYILVTTDHDTRKLQALYPKPRDQWKIRSVDRANTPMDLEHMFVVQDMLQE